MGKALMVGTESQTLASGEEATFFGHYNNSTEANSQYSATEGAVFSNLRTRTTSGGSGTNTFRFRDTGANGNQVVSYSGASAGEDTTNTDTLTAGDTFNLAYTDTGTDSVMDMVAVNVAMSSGHGCFHGASAAATVICDVASAVRYQAIGGALIADGTATIANAQWRVRGYTSLEAFQVRVTANARTNDSVFSINVNGSDVGTAITYGAGATGLQTVTGMGISLSPGDLVCISLTLGTGIEDLTVSFVGATLKSTSNASEVFYVATSPTARAASSTATYYLPGGSLGAEATETAERVKPGFAARCSNLRCYLSANTYTGNGTLKLYVNGSAVITTTLTAGGGAGWYENTSDTFDIDDNDEISFEIDEGTSGSISITAIGVTFAEIPAGGAIVGRGLTDSPLLRQRRMAA